MHIYAVNINKKLEYSSIYDKNYTEHNFSINSNFLFFFKSNFNNYFINVFINDLNYIWCIENNNLLFLIKSNNKMLFNWTIKNLNSKNSYQYFNMHYNYINDQITLKLINNDKNIHFLLLYNNELKIDFLLNNIYYFKINNNLIELESIKGIVFNCKI